MSSCSAAPVSPPAVADRDWETVWASHRAGVVRYADLLLRDAHAAEDVAQETGLRLWQHPEILRRDRDVGRWLRTVARNIVIDRARRRCARPTEVTLTSDIYGEVPGGYGLVEAIDSVADLLAGLSDDHRVALVEVYVRDRPVEEVAARLGIPVGTVKSRCHYAVRRLRARLATPPPARLARWEPGNVRCGRAVPRRGCRPVVTADSTHKTRCGL